MFYHDKELLHPYSTVNGHEVAEDFGEKECVREVDKSFGDIITISQRLQTYPEIKRRRTMGP